MKAFNALTPQGKIRRYHQLARLALQHYPIDVIKLRCISIRHNIIFRVQTSDDVFMLRMGYPSIRTHEMVSSEMQWLADMAQAGIDLTINTPIATKQGTWVQTCRIDTIPDAYEIVLMTWLDGQLLETNPSQASLFLLGSATATLHNFSQTYRPSQPFMNFDSFDVGEWGSINYLTDKQSPLSRSQKDLFSAMIAHTQSALKTLRERDGLKLIHGDLHLKNAVLHHGELGIFDFDDCRWGHDLQDLGVMLANLRDPSPKIQALRTAYLNGYKSKRAFNFDDADLIIATAHRLLMMLTFVINFRLHLSEAIIIDSERWLRDHISV